MNLQRPTALLLLFLVSLTHRFPLDRIQETYELFGNRKDGVMKVAITP